MPIDDVAAAGNRLATLQELRDHLARRLVNARDDNAASLAMRLESVLDKIAALDPDTGKGTALDEFSKRRAERKTPRPASPKKRQQRRG